MFAEDTCLTYVHHDWNFSVDYVDKRLSHIFDRCNFNKLSIDPAYSEFMFIDNRFIETESVLYLDRDRIICKNSVNYLGL